MAKKEESKPTAKKTAVKKETVKKASSAKVDRLKRVKEINKGYFAESDEFRGVESIKVQDKKTSGESYLIEVSEKNHRYNATLLLKDTISGTKYKFHSKEALEVFLK